VIQSENNFAITSQISGSHLFNGPAIIGSRDLIPALVTRTGRGPRGY
jgi:hypothetical protein